MAERKKCSIYFNSEVVKRAATPGGIGGVMEQVGCAEPAAYHASPIGVNLCIRHSEWYRERSDVSLTSLEVLADKDCQ